MTELVKLNTLTQNKNKLRKNPKNTLVGVTICWHSVKMLSNYIRSACEQYFYNYLFHPHSVYSAVSSFLFSREPLRHYTHTKFLLCLATQYFTLTPEDLVGEARPRGIVSGSLLVFSIQMVMIGNYFFL